MENELPLFDMTNIKIIVYIIVALETDSKDKLLEFKKASIKDNNGSMLIAFSNELTKQVKEGKCFGTIEVRVTIHMTQSWRLKMILYS